MNFNFFIDILFPKKCIVCEMPIKIGIICEECFNKIEINHSFFCGKCKARLSKAQKICHKDFPYILGAASSYNNEIVKMLIHNLKFKGIIDAGKPMAELIIKYISINKLNLENYIVIPIPLSKKRQKTRGFNQSEIIAKLFCEKFNLPFYKNIIFRNRDTSPQSSLKERNERKTNVEGCFSIYESISVKNKNIILIDDVATSGSTLYEAGKILKSAGCGKIIAIVVAIA